MAANVCCSLNRLEELAMTAALRLLVALVLVTTGLVTAGRDQPGWRWWQQRPATSWSRLVCPPGPQSEVIARRVKARTAVTTQLRLGELNLFEAAAYFRDINAEPAGYPDYLSRSFPGDSVNEKTCRQVICWLSGQLAKRAPPSEVRAVERRLEEELARHIAEHGRVVLPDWE
jgi:hypothetical protein